MENRSALTASNSIVSDANVSLEQSDEFSNDVTPNPDLYNTSKGGEGKKKKKSKKVSKPEKYYPLERERGQAWGEGKKSEGKHKSKSHFRKSTDGGAAGGKPKKPCNCGAGVK